MFSLRTRNRNSCSRSGLTMMEVVVAGSVLVVAMSLMVSTCFRINLNWKDIGHQRVAISELSNQLESLTRLTPAEAATELEKLEISSAAARTLKGAILQGQLMKDNLGTRVKLELKWKRAHEGTPVVLSGWLNPQAEESKVSESDVDGGESSEGEEADREEVEEEKSAPEESKAEENESEAGQSEVSEEDNDDQ